MLKVARNHIDDMSNSGFPVWIRRRIVSPIEIGCRLGIN